MRLYDKQFNESEPNWWKALRDEMQDYDGDYNTFRKTKPHNGKVVEYE